MRLRATGFRKSGKKYRRIMVQQLTYYLENDVDPSAPNAVTFTRGFMNNAVTLFIPLLVLSIGSDLISGERSSGTIKMLLTRPVRRWKILFAKLVALIFLYFADDYFNAHSVLCYIRHIFRIRGMESSCVYRFCDQRG